MTDPREFDAVAATVRASVLFRAASAVATACLTAADQSAVARQARDARVHFESRPCEERVRATAILVATATAGHLLLLFFVPAQIAPATPKVFWVVVAATASIAALVARPIAAGWRTSGLCRISARLRRPSAAARKS
jgi:hypothetical protein